MLSASKVQSTESTADLINRFWEHLWKLGPSTAAMANSCKKLTRRLEHRFFNKQADDHQIDDEVLFCCWKLRDYLPIYEQNPFSTLSDDQRRKLEESVAMHFNPSLRTQSGMNSFLFSRWSIYVLYLLQAVEARIRRTGTKFRWRNWLEKRSKPNKECRKQIDNDD